MSVRSDRDSQILVLENCQTRRRFCSAEILVNPFEDHSAIIWNMQGMGAPEPSVAAAMVVALALLAGVALVGYRVFKPQETLTRPNVVYPSVSRRRRMTNLRRSVYACCQNGSFDFPNRLFRSAAMA